MGLLVGEGVKDGLGAGVVSDVIVAATKTETPTKKIRTIAATMTVVIIRRCLRVGAISVCVCVCYSKRENYKEEEREEKIKFIPKQYRISTPVSL